MSTEPRPILELLSMLRKWYVENIKEGEFVGLCTATSQMLKDGMLLVEEMHILKKYVQDNAPVRIIDGSHRSPWNWPLGQLKPRVDWLDSEILKHESDDKGVN